MPHALRTTGLTWEVLDDEIVVLDLDGSMYFRVNGSGRVLWDLLQEPRTHDELTEALVAAYGIAAEQAAEDAARFIGELQERGLIEDA